VAASGARRPGVVLWILFDAVAVESRHLVEIFIGLI
jgi:hypothetical protein